MRILIITEIFHPDTIGGAGRVAAELARSLAASGHAVRVVTRMTALAPQATEDRDGFRLFRYPADPRNPFSILSETRRGLHEAVRRAVSGWRPDVLDLHQPHAAYHALALEELADIPAVYTFHSSWADEMRIRGGAFALFAPIAGRVEAAAIDHVNRVVVLSEYSRRRVAAIVPRVEAEIVPGGVDLDRFALKPERPRQAPPKSAIHGAGGRVGASVLGGDRMSQNAEGTASPPVAAPPAILTVRNLVRRMGLDALIDAAIMLKDSGVAFELGIGGEGPLNQELRERARPLGAACRFLGRIPEERLAEYYRAADLFVLPTAAIEGFGLVILEAFASGTPVLGTPIGAIPELVGLQGDGYLSTGITALEIADAIRHFLTRTDPIAPAALRGLAEAYSWTRRAEAMTRIYEHLVRASVGAG
jgi:glycosyltransferase involved in cell wall biosynthesis